MKVYTRRSDGCYVAYEGMDPPAILSMLAAQGLTCEFLTPEQWAAAPR